MGCLWRLFKTIVVLFILGFILKTYGAQWLMSFYLQRELGAEISITETHVDYVNTQIKFQDMVIRNPMVFPAGNMILVSHLYLDWNAAALLRGKVRFNRADLDIREIRAVRTGAGVNLRALKPLQLESGALGEKASSFAIRDFVLSIDHITMTDTTGPHPLQRSHPVNIRHLSFQDVNGLPELFRHLARVVEEQTGQTL